MFCYVVYLLLDWPGIHTCLITCFIVSLGTAAETVEKQALRFLGCGIGAAAGIAAIVFLMPNVTSIGGLMGVVFLAALVSGWIAARRAAHLLCRLPARLRLLPQRDPGRGARLRHDDRARSDHRHPVRRSRRRDRLHADLAGDDRRAHRSGDRGLAASGRRPGLGGEHAEALGARRGSREQTSRPSSRISISPTMSRPRSGLPRPGWTSGGTSPRILSSLQGPLLIGADQEPAGFAGTALPP